MCVKVSSHKVGILPLPSRMGWEGNLPSAGFLGPACVCHCPELQSWLRDLCKAANVSTPSLLVAWHNQVIALLSFWSFQCPHWKGPCISGSISSELAFLSSRPVSEGYTCWWVSGSKKGANWHLFGGLFMKDEEKKASLLLGHLKPVFQLLENLLDGNGDAGRDAGNQNPCFMHRFLRWGGAWRLEAFWCLKLTET